MADGNRVYPVDYLIMHHAVSDDMENWEDLEVQDWYDKTGAGRGYKGISRSYHEHPQRNKETFAQAHYCLHKYTKDGNKYGWRLTLLMKDPFNNVAWGAGNWPVNQRSINIETSGNFLNQELPLEAAMLVADFFREYDKSIGGRLNVFPHQQFSATACPGRIKERIGTVVDMINNPQNYANLFKPKETIMPESVVNQIKQDYENKLASKDQIYLSLNKLKEASDEQVKLLTAEKEQWTIDKKDLTNKYNELEGKYNSLELKLNEVLGLNETYKTQIAEKDKKIEELEIKFSAFDKNPNKQLEREIIKVIDPQVLSKPFVGWWKKFQNGENFRFVRMFLTHISPPMLGLFLLNLINFIPVVTEHFYGIVLPHIPQDFLNAFTAAYGTFKVWEVGQIAKLKSDALTNSEQIYKELTRDPNAPSVLESKGQ